MNRQFAVSAGIALAIGIAITYWPVMFIASIFVPALALRQTKRLYATAVAFAYYGGAIWLAVPAAKAFFGPNAGFADGVAIWFCGAVLLSLPYAILWTSTRRFIGLRSAAAVLTSVPPPLGIIGVASPLTAAGLLFPGTASFGLAGTLAAIIALTLRPVAATVTIALLAAVCNLIYPGTPKPPADWEAVNTKLGDVGRSAEAEFKAADFIQQHALSSHAHVMIFPESVVPRWTEATDQFWQPTLDTLAQSGKTVLVGTTFDILGKWEYESGIAIRGAQTGVFLQHIPVPIGMWNPLTSDGAELQLFRPVTTTIRGKQTAIVVCYEELLTWPMLAAVLSKRDIVVGVANEHYEGRNLISTVEVSIAKIWIRLVGTPILIATNH